MALERGDQMITVLGGLVLEGIRGMLSPFKAQFDGWNEYSKCVQGMLCVARAAPRPFAHVKGWPSVQAKIGTK
jgi:hypothetical protein